MKDAAGFRTTMTERMTTEAGTAPGRKGRIKAGTAGIPEAAADKTNGCQDKPSAGQSREREGWGRAAPVFHFLHRMRFPRPIGFLMHPRIFSSSMVWTKRKESV